VNKKKLHEVIVKAWDLLDYLLEWRVSESGEPEELKTNKKDHYPIYWVETRGVITRVICSCGEETNYIAPLGTLTDFECPSKRAR
jgi:hypothetical protein